MVEGMSRFGKNVASVAYGCMITLWLYVGCATLGLMPISQTRNLSSFHQFPLMRIYLQLLTAVILLANVIASADYYKTLGVRRDATASQIKSAYRKLSKQFHPDKNKSAEAEKRFHEVSEAFDVLSDAEKRGIYNQHGQEGVKRHMSGQSAGGHDPHDIFSRFFGGGRQQQQERKGPNMVSEVLVDLKDIYVGKTFDVS